MARGYRILLLDQRGTGRSTAITTQQLQHYAETHIQLKQDKSNIGNIQANFVKYMRSDAIAEDVEHIRLVLLGIVVVVVVVVVAPCKVVVVVAPCKVVVSVVVVVVAPCNDRLRLQYNTLT